MGKDSYRVVAIDGPAASGKSSVARELARRLGFAYVNSGAIYRAITWHILQNGINPGDTARVTQAVESARIACHLENNESRVFIDNVDPTNYLREDRVNEGVSRVSTIRRIREIVVNKMRHYARSHDLVVEGRDIGSVVFPEGARTLDGDLQPAQPGLGLVIAKTLAPVVPMRIFGAHESLPRGGGGLHFVPITIVVGEPIFFTAADLGSRGKDLYGRLSQRVMDAIAALPLD